jgi:DNA-binding response OmpR family regulator
MENETNTDKTKILIVDDNRIIRQLIRLTFSTDPEFELLEAENGQQALDLVNQEHPDYLVLDIMMPGDLNGFQVCEKIKSNPETQDCVVILLSARCQQDDFAEGSRVGADQYVTKPFSPTDLIKLIKQN